MTTLPPAEIGSPFRNIDTPALIVDLDAFERNLETMAAAADRLGVRLRPHAKTHKSPIIASKQIARGAVGVCCQKVAEAEVLVAGGVTDVLVSNEVVGPFKLERLASLARHARISVCVDHVDNVGQLAAAAERARHIAWDIGSLAVAQLVDRAALPPPGGVEVFSAGGHAAFICPTVRR